MEVEKSFVNFYSVSSTNAQYIGGERSALERASNAPPPSCHSTMKSVFGKDRHSGDVIVYTCQLQKRHSITIMQRFFQKKTGRRSSLFSGLKGIGEFARQESALFIVDRRQIEILNILEKFRKYI